MQRGVGMGRAAFRKADITPISPRTVKSVLRAVGSLMVRASDSRPEGLSSMPDATKYPPSTHGVRAC
ncbi:hypothetical protein TNCV_2361461 [Trichonephila clavipes]|nr:hypothetical protein TNCV_2361461 [Trichonephila clavipes]